MAIQKPTNKTVFASLVNKNGLRASYKMEVHFVCNITKSFSYNI